MRHVHPSIPLPTCIGMDPIGQVAVKPDIQSFMTICRKILDLATIGQKVDHST